MPEITEAKLYEAFGLEAPAGDTGAGAQAQEIAEPAAEGAFTETGTGAQAQEVAEPAAAEETVEPEDHSEPTAGKAEDEADPGHNSGTNPQTPEERRKNAARRRQQEQQAAIDQAVSAALQAHKDQQEVQMKDFFERLGIKNSYTGETIKSMDEFYEWKNKFDMEKLNDDLKAGKATAEQLSQMISNHPDVKLAQQVVQQTQQEQAQRREADAHAVIEQEIAEIGKLNPGIKGIGDILAMSTAPQFREYVDKGYSFADAYRLANFESLTAQKADAARQQAINNTRGKDHLKATGGARGGGAVAVPAKDMAMFRAFNPNASEADIQAYYNKYKNS